MQMVLARSRVPGWRYLLTIGLDREYICPLLHDLLPADVRPYITQFLWSPSVGTSICAPDTDRTIRLSNISRSNAGTSYVHPSFGTPMLLVFPLMSHLAVFQLIEVPRIPPGDCGDILPGDSS
eukprot:gnl/Trimastix_PCT/2540.p1 GENE.gnl/Trimastix_PCT/2540~~gnl/Trimastix_PCT/2540.p1  ORF type:complete len:123 (+),score=27.21 gnl/Trimastix_PCT/2540:580-948(+)